jgi:hypothetical protein
MQTPLAPEDRVPQDPGEVLRDYVLRPYAPVCALSGRLHSVSALRWFLRTRGLTAAWPIAARCQEVLGPGETVWGFKRKADGGAGVELYFYKDQGAADPGAKTVSALRSALADLLTIDSELDESLDYVMCSLELDEATLSSGRSPGFRVYTPGTRPAHGYDGLSYLVSGRRLLRENSYCFYSAAEELEVVRERVRHSPRAGRGLKLLPEALTDCYTICYAVKAEADALYFSRVTTRQARRFMAALWPEIGALFRAHAEDFAHLRWDIGYDFSAPSTDLGAPAIHKLGLYGYL